MQSEMEPNRDNQQGAQQYAGYAGIDTNRPDRSMVPAIDVGGQIQNQAAASNLLFTRFIGGYPSDLDEEARLRREDNRWAMINLLMVPFGVLLIVIGVIATLANPTIGIATIISGIITDCIPELSSRQRAAVWKRLRSYRQQEFLEQLIRTSKGELQKRAFKAYVQLENPKDEEESG